MRLCVPEYYEHFQCSASACQDNCCIGWEIDIDPESDRQYRQVGGAFGARLQASIRREGDTPCFRLAAERCVFLNEENLCEIILHLGEEALCQICRDHPRFTETFGTLRETGVGLCCPEAGRLLFSRPEPVRFCHRETPEEGIAKECNQDRLRALLLARENLVGLVQNRDLPLTERMCRALEFAQGAQNALERGEWNAVAAPEPVCAEGAALSFGGAARQLWGWLEELSGLEAISPAWTELLEETKRVLVQPEPAIRALWGRFRRAVSDRWYEYEHLLVYFLFRYFLKSVYTGDCLTPVQLAVVSSLIVGAMDLTRFEARGQFPLAERIRIAGLYSKQMEYSEENRVALEDRLIFDESFSCRKMEGILAAVGKRD